MTDNRPTAQQLDRWLDILGCPDCQGHLIFQPGGSGLLRCTGCGQVYPVVNGIPRFVEAQNYAANFGMQWNRFPKTQLDSHSGLSITRDRLIGETGWSEGDLRDQLVLEAGSGAGRFTEIVLGMGARLVSVDYSNAVEANLANNGPNPALLVVQADICKPPFAPYSFDRVFCLGVIQHTPVPAITFRALARMPKPGGTLVIDAYIKRLRTLLHSKYALRPFTRRMDEDKLLALVEQMVRWLLPVSDMLGGVPAIGHYLQRLVPVINYRKAYPLSDKQVYEWAVLDTFDALGATFDNPVTANEMRLWFQDAGYTEIEVFVARALVGRGRAPLSAAHPDS
jgi:SAM-dependent methyltransferase